MRGDIKMEKKQETVETEEINDVVYKKEHVTFIIKPIRISQVERWANWCADRGLNTRKDQPKAFALAMDILEGRTHDLINSSKILESLETAVRAHDNLLKQIIIKIGELDAEPEEEEPNPNQVARDAVLKRKELREKAQQGDGKNA